MKKRHLSIEDDFFSLAKPSLHRKQKRKRSVPLHTPLLSLLQSDQPLMLLVLLVLLVLMVQLQHSTTHSSFQLNSSIRSTSTDQNIPSRCSSITPPPVVDRDALRSQIEQRLRDSKSEPFPLSDDEEEDTDKDIGKEKGESPTSRAGIAAPSLNSSSTAVGSPSSPNISEYRFNEDNECKRIYSLTLYNKLSVPQNVDKTIPTIFMLKGTKLFLRVLEQSIKYFRSQYTLALSPPQLQEYDPDHTTLVWVEGKMILKLFYRPLTLRVSPPVEFDPTAHAVEDMPPTELTCILVPQEHAHNFTDVYPEFAKKSNTPSAQFPMTDVIFKPAPVIPAQSQSPHPPLRQKSDFFVIGLKGRDNKRIDVEVNATTSLVSLLKHYAKVKTIDPGELSNAKLIFDDERLDLSTCVGDTELEEDFEVQVVL